MRDGHGEGLFCVAWLQPIRMGSGGAGGKDSLRLLRFADFMDPGYAAFHDCPERVGVSGMIGNGAAAPGHERHARSGGGL